MVRIVGPRTQNAAKRARSGVKNYGNLWGGYQQFQNFLVINLFVYISEDSNYLEDN